MPDTSGNDDIQRSRLGVLQGGLNSDEFEPGALPPALLNTNGGPVPPSPPPRKLPVATPEQFVCLRGPCRFYMETTSPADVENAAFEPVVIDRYCKAMPGVLLELSEDSVYACTEWDPMEINPGRKKRRDLYMRSKEGKACVQADNKRIKERADARAIIDSEHGERAQKRKLEEAQKQINIDAGNFEPQEE